MFTDNQQVPVGDTPLELCVESTTNVTAATGLAVKTSLATVALHEGFAALAPVLLLGAGVVRIGRFI